MSEGKTGLQDYKSMGDQIDSYVYYDAIFKILMRFNVYAFLGVWIIVFSQSIKDILFLQSREIQSLNLPRECMFIVIDIFTHPML